MENLPRLILISLFILLLAGVVYAEAQHLVLQPGDSAVLTCAGQHHAVVHEAGDMVTVSCQPNPVYPPEHHRLYLPAVAHDA